MRCFCPANTCSTAERTADRFALALAMRSGIGRRGGENGGAKLDHGSGGEVLLRAA
jgi:hypothetical protein